MKDSFLSDDSRNSGMYCIPVGVALLLSQVLMFAVTFQVALRSLSRVPAGSSVNISMNCLGIMLASLISLSVLRGRNYERIDVYLILILFVSTLYMFSDGLFWVIDGQPRLYVLNVVVNLLYCICPAVMTMIFWAFLGILSGRAHPLYRPASLVMHVDFCLTLLFLAGNLIWKYYYSISPETGIYSRGILYPYYLVLPSVMFITCCAYIAVGHLSPLEKIILFSYPLVPYASSLLTIGKNGPAPLSISAFCAIVFFYTNLYVLREQQNIAQKRALTESQLRSLQMQINPHFFYNTLTSLASLCESDPEGAQEMVYLIADYMRDSISDNSRPSLIPFSEEREILKHYFSIESIRFPKIQLNFDLQGENFMIPSFTLQPLVENAIKHGICKRRKSEGKILVTTRETSDFWFITIADDGVGFDTGRNLPAQDGRSHIGIQNVRTRLQLLCQGTLEIYSQPDRGTTCEIHIPKPAAEKEDRLL